MTSRERFESQYGKRENFAMPPIMWDALYEVWQAAERDMLARCVEVLTRYNDCSDAYEEMKEILND